MKDKTIDQIIDDIIRREGGYVNHPSDRGGPTKYGVTLATLSDYRGRACTESDVKALTKAEVASIYFQKYFVEPGINNLPAEIHPVVFDMAVNMGPAQTIKLLQRALSLLQDGIIGPKTIMVARNAIGNTNYLQKRITFERVRFYQQIVKNNPGQKVFLAGWIKRANEFV